MKIWGKFLKKYNTKSSLASSPPKNTHGLGYVRIMHMASIARAGETMISRCLNAHSKLQVLNEITDNETPKAKKLFKKLSRFEGESISVEELKKSGVDIPPGNTIVLKQGTWEHKYPFSGFILTRNPASVYASGLLYYTIRKKMLSSHNQYKENQVGHGLTDLSKPVNSGSLEKYKGLLDEKEFEQIKALTYPTCRLYGYNLAWQEITLDSGVFKGNRHDPW